MTDQTAEKLAEELAGARATIDHMSKAMSWICGHDRQGLDHLEEAQYEGRARMAAVEQARRWAVRARTAEAALIHLTAASAVSLPPTTDQTDDAPFGSDGCACIPFTRQTDPLRYLDQPGDNADQISGWTPAADCPHHAPAVEDDGPSRRTGLRDQLRRAFCEHEGRFVWGSDMLEPDEYGEQADTALAVLLREWPWLRAETEDAAPVVAPGSLHDRIAHALEREDALNCGYDHGFASTYGTDPETDGFVNAVLAVLPGDTRADVLREAATRLWHQTTGLTEYGQGARWAIGELRRMAAETTQPDTGPRRGDAFDLWLKTQRDEHRDDDRGQWSTLDQLLDLYRLHADTGTPLSEHVCEGRAVGDCECLEPAAPVQQPATEEPR